MRHGYLPSILAGACLLLVGCPTVTDPTVTDPTELDPTETGPPLNEAIKVVGAGLVNSPLALKDTGGPTVVPPRVTSNSSKSFDVEVAEVDAAHTLEDVAQLNIAVEGFGGHYVFDVGPDDRTPAGSILVTIVQEQPALLSGEFTLQIVAADAEGRVGEIADVSAAFFAASAGDDSLAGVGETVALDATFTGETGPPRVTWSQVARPDAPIANSSSASATFVPPTVGTYVMKLKAVDPSGVVDVDLVSILVVDAFTVDAGESGVVTVGDTVQLRGLAAGGSGQASFAWTEISDHNVEIQDSDSRVASFVALETGEYEFELTAIDDISGEASDRVIHLAVDRLTAIANAPSRSEPEETVQLQGQAGGGLFPYAFRWSQTGGPPAEIEDETNQTALATLPSPGTYVFELRVEDSTGDAASNQATVIVDSPCGDACPEGQTCDPVTRECVCDANAACDDGDECTADICDVDTGECSHDALVCDDENLCTADTCDAELGCAFTELVCEGGRVCVEGVCTTVCTTASECDDGLFCNGVETCSIAEGETEGACAAGTDPCDSGTICDEDNGDCPTPPCVTDADCDDGEECTTNTCGSESICVFPDIVCDGGEICIEGDCIVPCTSADDCDDNVFCNGAETCRDGLCEPGTFPCMTDEMCLDDKDECRGKDTYVFADDYEQGLGNWFVDNGMWEVGVPSSGPGNAYSREQLAATVLAGNYPGNSSRLVSPTLRLPVITVDEEMRLRFWHWFSFASTIWGSESGVVQIREQIAPGEWTSWTSLQSFSRSSSVYTHASVDLSGHAGKNVQIGFLLSCCGSRSSSAGWYVDDVTIEAF